MARRNPNGEGGIATSMPAPVQPAQQAPPPRTPDDGPVGRVKAMLETSSDRLAAVLPRHLTPERVVQVVCTQVYRNPRLQRCDRGSILAAVIRACSLGLDLEPSANEAHLVPRYNGQTKVEECQFQPGYQGLRKLAMRTGRYTLIEARIVHERDEFHVSYEPELVFVHRPDFGEDPGEVLYAYAVAKQANGERQIKVLNRRDIEEKHHQRSESYRTAQRKGEPERGPWVTDWAEMARKSALIALSKDLEKSHELIDALAAEFALNRPAEAPIEVASPPGPPLRGSAALAARLALPEPEPAFAEGTAGQIGWEAEEEPRADEREPGADG